MLKLVLPWKLLYKIANNLVEADYSLVWVDVKFIAVSYAKPGTPKNANSIFKLSSVCLSSKNLLQYIFSSSR